MISAARITSRTYRAYRRKRSIKDARLSLLFVSLLKTEVFVFFFGANRKDVSQKSTFFIGGVCLWRERISSLVTNTQKKEKKGEREKSRGGYFFLRRLLSRDDEILLFVSAFQHHRRERKSEIFLQPHKCKRRKKEEKTGLIRPLVLACNHLTSSRHVLRSVVRTNTKLRDAEDTQKARTREQETWYKNR